jgi:hypothetical protein
MDCGALTLYLPGGRKKSEQSPETDTRPVGIRIVAQISFLSNPSFILLTACLTIVPEICKSRKYFMVVNSWRSVVSRMRRIIAGNEKPNLMK